MWRWLPMALVSIGLYAAELSPAVRERIEAGWLRGEQVTWQSRALRGPPLASPALDGQVPTIEEFRLRSPAK
ncbi:MAG: hypothetical protein HZB16_24530 [Armatimonadetes bacterium]|nr:hypothetical protein [Armatimonadota bacterium]